MLKGSDRQILKKKLQKLRLRKKQNEKANSKDPDETAHIKQTL